MAEPDFDGDKCVVLPKNYLQSAQAVSEIYEDELTEIATNLEVDSLRRRPRVFRALLLALLVWAAPSVWMICR
jgi:hypothetical protein